MSDLFDLNGRVAIITGGARGIGGAIADAFAVAGAKVVIADFDAEAGAAHCAALGESGFPDCLFVRTDVSSEPSVQALISETLARFGQLDILVNCAGILNDGTAETITKENWERMMAVDLTGVFLCSKYALGPMKTRGRGVIINVSSSSSIVGFPYTSVSYCTAKGGVSTMTRQMAMQEGRFGIRVNALAPGSTFTELIFHRTPQQIESQANRIPIGRLGRIEEQAAAALFLASDASSYLNGEIMHVNGGMYMQ